MTNDEKRCPVCGKYDFENPGCYDECPIFGWVDDPVQRDEHDYENGFNYWSVNQGNRSYPLVDVCWHTIWNGKGKKLPGSI